MKRLLIITLLLAASAASAQTELEDRLEKVEEALRQTRTDTRRLEVIEEDRLKAKPIAGWNLKDGFFVQAPDGYYKLRIGGYAHADGRFFVDNEDPASDSQFTLRRARLDIRANLAQYFELRILPDFQGGRIQLQDFYLDAKYFPEAYVRVGKFKSLIGLERITSATSLVFIERAFPTSLAPNRDLGALLMGDIARGQYSYAIGIANGVPDGASNGSDTDLNGDKDFLGRVFVHPLQNSSVPALRGLGLGVAGTFGRQVTSPTSPDLPSFRTSGQARYFSYRTDTPPTTAGTTTPDGAHYRWSPQAYYYFGPFGLLGEYISASQRLVRGEEDEEVTNDAWQIQASYVLTGEPVTFKGVAPAKVFDPRKGTWGAWQVAARYSELDIDNEVFDAGFADSTRSASKASMWSVGLNWYLNPNVMFALNFDRTDFEEGASSGDRKPENLILTRVQFLL